MEFGGADRALTGVPTFVNRLSCSRAWNRAAVGLLLLSEMAVIVGAALLACVVA